MSTACHFKGEILETLAQFGLDSTKVTAVCTDNATNVIKAVDLMDSLFGSYFAALCQLSFQIDIVKELMSKLSKLAGKFRKSTSMSSELWQMQKDIDRPVSLIHNVVTR